MNNRPTLRPATTPHPNRHRTSTRLRLATALLLPTISLAAQAQDAVEQPATEELVMAQAPELSDGLIMNFQQASLKMVLDYLAEEAGLIIVNEVELQGRVNIKNVKPVSLNDALDALNTVLFEEGFTAVRRGRVLKVVTLEDAKNQSIPVHYGNDPEAIPLTDTIVTQVVPIRYANPDEIQQDLADLIDDDFAEMTSNQSARALIITDTQANIRRLVQIISSLDQSVEQVSEMRVFKLEYADADDTARLIEATFRTGLSEEELTSRVVQRQWGGRGRGGQGGQQNNGGNDRLTTRTAVIAEADVRTNSIVVSADPEMMIEIAAVIKELDSDNTAKDSVLIYHVKNMQATDLADIFNNLFEDTSRNGSDQRFGGQQGATNVRSAARVAAATGSDNAADLVGQVTAEANEDTNSLLILTPEKNFARVQEILDELDRPVPQVLVRVLVSEVTYDEGLDLGTEFEALNVGAGTGATGTDDNILTDFELFESTLGFNFLLLDDDNFRFAVRALSATGRFDVLSRPYLLTADNQEATINVGERVPIVTNSRVDEDGDIISTIEYEDIGIILSVTPQINSEGLVVMDVSQEISSISDLAIPVAADQDLVVFNQRELTSQVAVGHGQTVVLGGLVEDELTETVRKVPLLGDIPVLGNLFKRTERNKRKTELLIFLTPEVIETPDQLTPATEKIKSESETLKDAFEPGRLQDHLDKLEATPGNAGPMAPPNQVIPPAEDTEPAPDPDDEAADAAAQQQQRDLLLARLQQWQGE